MSAPAIGASPTPPRLGRSQSLSPPPRRPRHRDADGREMVVREVITEAGGLVSYPMLTRTNYTDWAVLMRVNLQAQGLWDVVSTGDAPHCTDH
ncbi:hypothetical protein E2562_009283 [Oryza meyeriana var. granulata]|uniref:DUF4219 domain-containing protein n=1 Tax=Oryza meyeriana var. granulata TaxID=110450 RepID=A0A6G1EAU1_9ORYZ|nr:hypothetical protein E2562_009283 [Oryza meyeriana var. granulata]